MAQGQWRSQRFLIRIFDTNLHLLCYINLDAATPNFSFSILCNHN